MGLFEHWPYTNFHDLNLDWILNKVKNIEETVKTELGPPVNVLTLGVKNDGSEDVSAILNKYQGTAPLFFPSGTYLVLNTISLKVSVLGSGYGRGHNANGTLFKQGSAVAAPVLLFDAVNENLQKDIRIYNIGIQLNYDGNGINCNLHGDSVTFTFDKVSVIGLQEGRALYFDNDRPQTASRAVYGSNIFVLGKCCAYDSYGLFANNYIGDCQWNTIELMGVRTGIRLNSGIHNFVNVHVWTGLYGAYTATAAQAKATIGVSLMYHARANFVNLYTDTTNIAIALRDRCVMDLVNWTHWDDGTLDSVNDSGKGLVYMTNTNNVCSINNATIKMPLGLSYFATVLADVRIYGAIRVINNYYETSGANVFRVMQDFHKKYMIGYQMPTDVPTYVPVAFIQPAYNGTTTLKFVGETGTTDRLELKYTAGASVTVTEANVTRISGTTGFHLYYKTIGNAIVLFMVLNNQATPWNMPINVSVEEMDTRGIVLNPLTELFIENGATPLAVALTTTDPSELTAVSY